MYSDTKIQVWIPLWVSIQESDIIIINIFHTQPIEALSVFMCLYAL